MSFATPAANLPPPSFSPRVISVAPGLTHLLLVRPLRVPAVVVPAHQLHARAVQALLAVEVQVPRLARSEMGQNTHFNARKKVLEEYHSTSHLTGVTVVVSNFILPTSIQ